MEHKQLKRHLNARAMEIHDELVKMSERISNAREGEVIALKCDASCLKARYDELRRLGEQFNIIILTLKPIPYVTD